MVLHGRCCPLIREAGRLILYTYTIVLYGCNTSLGHSRLAIAFGVLDAFKHCIAMVVRAGD